MSSALTFAQVKPFIEADLKCRQTPALLGEPGIGKSSLIEDLARAFKTKVFTLPVNQLADRADLTGVRMVKSEETGKYRQEAFPHSTIMDAIEYAEQNPDEEPILFLDEFNRASSDITSSILSFQTLRRIGTIDFPDNMRLIVAGNDKGNVTSLDAASISRFSVYRVKPDLETFMSIQTLNPFVRDVLTKHPEDLTALAYERKAQASDQDSTDEDEENPGAFDMSGLEFGGEEAFAQITCPRTITYLSQWLSTMGFDKSGSDKERELLGAMFTSMSDGDEDNILLSAIEGHVGQTTFALHLFEEINQHFNSMLTKTHVSAQPLLMNLRPKQDIVNQLSRSKTTQEIETLVSSMTENERVSTLIWLTENTSVMEINNNQAVEAYMKNAPLQITDLDNVAIQNLMRILPDSTRLSSLSVKAMMSSTAPSITKWAMMINSAIDMN